MKENKVWFASDFHYGHVNICGGTTQWVDHGTTRDFDTVEEMNITILKSINDVVAEDDELYFLGDWSFGGIRNIWNFRKQIICNNIHFIPGNHDNNIIKNKPLPNCHWELFDDEIVDGVWRAADEFVFAQELFLMHPKIKELIYKDQKFILSHYPLEQWEDMDKGSIHLHGHVHHTLDGSDLNMFFKRMDVGWEGKIYSADDIIAEMNKKENKTHIK